MPRIIVRRLRRLRSVFRRGARLNIAIKTSAERGTGGDVWGDVFFADDLARSIRKHGHRVVIDRHEERIRDPHWGLDDVVIHLRGLFPSPPEPGAINILWVISHPDLVDADELRSGYDLIFAASESSAARMSRESGLSVTPLLQATNPERFFPGPKTPSVETDVLFVGKSRNVLRPIVRDSIAIGADLSIYGDGWEQFIDPDLIVASFLDNARVPDAYRSARVVLNDHWEDMRLEGMLSNRLFDAAACGAVIVSDDIQGLSPLFGGSVVPYSTQTDLRLLLSEDYEWPSAEARRETALTVARLHSFDARATTLVEGIHRTARRQLAHVLTTRWRRQPPA